MGASPVSQPESCRSHAPRNKNGCAMQNTKNACRAGGKGATPPPPPLAWKIQKATWKSCF